MMVPSECVAFVVSDRLCYLLKSVGVDRLLFLFCNAAATAFTSELWVALLPINTVVPSLLVLLPLGCCCEWNNQWLVSKHFSPLYSLHSFFYFYKLLVASCSITCCWDVGLLLNLIFCCSCCWICACFCRCSCAVNTIELLLLMTPVIFVPVGFDATVASWRKRREVNFD